MWFILVVILIVIVVVLYNQRTTVDNKTTLKTKQLKFKVGDGWTWTISTTNNNEVVRSSSEKIIADWLQSKWYIYGYERPIIVDGYPKACPDFYLPKQNVYLEFWGEINEWYKEDRKKKQAFYYSNMIKVIEIYPWDLWSKSKTWKSFPDLEKLENKFISECKRLWIKRD